MFVLNEISDIGLVSFSKKKNKRHRSGDLRLWVKKYFKRWRFEVDQLRSRKTFEESG